MDLWYIILRLKITTISNNAVSLREIFAEHETRHRFCLLKKRCHEMNTLCKFWKILKTKLDCPEHGIHRKPELFTPNQDY